MKKMVHDVDNEAIKTSHRHVKHYEATYVGSQKLTFLTLNVIKW